jgi:hypothetical protein
MKKKNILSTFLIILILSMSGCRQSEEELLIIDVFPFTDDTPQAQGVFNFLNDVTTDFILLDIDVDLDRRAAQNIIDHRNGPDGIYNTEDDDPLGSVAELDGISYVGPSAIEKIYQYALDNEWVLEQADILGSFDGVQFTNSEAEAVLSLVNTADLETLDVDVALDIRAANAIVNNRPVLDMDALTVLSYVGTSALEKLKYYAKANGYPLVTITDPIEISVTSLQNEYETNGVNSSFYDLIVVVSRVVVTSVPVKLISGNAYFYIADPIKGKVEQLKVYIANSAGFDLSSLSVHDELYLKGKFTTYNDEFEIIIDDSEIHSYELLKNGLDYSYYQNLTGAWPSTAANPEGAVLLEASFGYSYMIPLPLFTDHPAFDGVDIGKPRDLGNEPDYNWNINAQSLLNEWLAAN